MAIVEMKKVTLVAMREDCEKLLTSMQKMGCIEISEHDDEELQAFVADSEALEASEKRLAQIESAIKALAGYGEKKGGLFAEKPVLDPSLVEEEQLSSVLSRLEEIERNLLEIRGSRARIDNQIEQWQPWRELTIPVEQVKDTEHCHVQLGIVEKFKADYFVEQMTASGAVVEVLSRDRSGVNVLVVNHKDDSESLAPIFKEAGFARAHFSGIQGTFDNNIRMLELELAKLNRRSQTLSEEKRSLAQYLPALEAAYDLELIQRDRLRATQRLLCTEKAFLMHGWVPAEKVPALEKEIKKISPNTVLEVADPEDDDKPPVLLKNKWFASQFEGVVAMFSLPSYKGFDPTTVMGPFFVLLFGMMVGDAGYGIIMSILAALFLKFMKPQGMIKQIAGILILGGVATAFWGFMFGGIFGIEITPWLFAPMDEPLLMLGLCFGVGFIHLLAGLGFAAYMNIKRGKVLDAILDQGLWVLTLFGLPMLAVPQLAGVGKVLSIIGVGGLALTAGRNAQGGPLKKLLSGLGSLYNLSGYLSDILSYARLFGMGLATGIIGMVFNTVAGMIMGNPIGFVLGAAFLLVGHAFNLFINALGAFVHASRLQYIEFFSKFYEAGGRTFRPLKVVTKYMQVKEDSLS
ncbi:MAG TPA: V-type ATP synthase subunit I [Bacillota bacterium]|nr:V-type ATP synthase subunit I [Bacillota bacterium]HPT60114.1 V-type ATP synthase subunit I [Bacillota bacterium]